MLIIFRGWVYVNASSPYMIADYMVAVSPHLKMGDSGTVCPALTKIQYVDDQEHCVYTSVAYGILAAVVVLVLVLAFTAVYCCIMRRRNKRRFSQHTRHDDNTSIGGYPYQPLAGNAEGYSNYGTVDSGIEDNLRSPSQSQTGSIAERLSQQQDTSSVASSHASMNPNYDEVSLNQRRVALANRPRQPTPDSRQGRPDKANAERRSLSLSNSSQRKNPQDKPDSMYASVDVTAFALERPITDHKVGNVNSQNAAEYPVDKLSAPDSPEYAVLEEPEAESTMSNEPNDKDLDDNKVQSHDNIDYAVLEPPLPALPGDGLSAGISTEGNPDEFDAEHTGSPGSEESSEEERYLTLLPPLQYPTEEVDTVKVRSRPDGMAHKPRKRLESRADHEEFLVDQLKNIPANERNGVFLVRESESMPGFNVLTMFCKKPGSEKEIYHFKICFSDDGQVHLSTGRVYFPDVDSLLQYLKENQDMLPCVLTKQLYSTGNVLA